MKNTKTEIKMTAEDYSFNKECSPAQCKRLIAFTLSRLDQILEGAADFSSEEACLICNDISSIAETLIDTTGASPTNRLQSNLPFIGGTCDETTRIDKEHTDLQCV